MQHFFDQAIKMLAVTSRFSYLIVNDTLRPSPISKSL